MESSKAKEVWLTRFMFGEKLEKIADCCSFDEAMAAVAGWKDAHKADPEYRVEKYDRVIYGNEKGTAVDFGDYSYFMLIIPACKPEDAS